MCKHNKNRTNWIKELVNIVIGGALIGLFSLFFLPPIAIQYWWLVWLVSSISILLWRLFKKIRRTLANRNE
jgi:amino acid transporter